MNFYRIDLMFHDGTGPWATIVDKGICVVSDKTHVETRLPDNLPARFAHLNGLSFSSTVRNELSEGDTIGVAHRGVRFKRIRYSHPERWTVRTLWVTKEELEQILLTMELLVALELDYDFRGAIGCVASGHEDPEKYFCSEVVYDAVCTVWLPENLNYKMHPDKLDVYVEKIEARLLERKFKVEGI